ncbi:MAG: phosphopentomutase [Chloroflexota bacterium]
MDQSVDRVIIIVLDGVGIGDAPDAAEYGDTGSNSVGNVARVLGGIALPNLAALGLGNLTAIEGVPPQAKTLGSYGRLTEHSAGKDTVTGHWEMVGILSERPQPTYPHGFPAAILAEFERVTGRGVLGNRPASGTEIIKDLGDEHARTGKWIVYTSADSVFQVAAHEEVIPLAELYSACEAARTMLKGEHAVGRVIARPFLGPRGSYARDNEARRDWALSPPGVTVLDRLVERGLPVYGVGKIADIFGGRGVTTNTHALNNAGALEATLTLLDTAEHGLIFSNLIEYDMIYGHRNDPRGYAAALRRFDDALPALYPRMHPRDVLVITGDHGCDPTTPGTEHSRERVPLLGYGRPVRSGVDIGTRRTFADLGATIADLLEVPRPPHGDSFAPLIAR